MSEEFLNQNSNQKMLSDAEVQRRRNVANNANNVRLAADVASKTNNPYAKAAGTAVKVADKLSNGKASEKLGKTLNTAMKMQGLKGKMMQAAMNKMSENGTSNRIANAANKKNGAPNTPYKKGTLSGSNVEDNTSKMKETEDRASDGGSAGIKVSFNVVKWGLIFCAGAFPVMIFLCLLMSASNIYIKSIGLGNADSVGFEDAESKINKKQEDTETIEEGVTDDDLSYDIFIEDNQNTFKSKKLENVNLVKIAKTTYLRRKYTEADLSNLEDFYPSVTNLSKNYDENMVYDFFFKMYNLYTSYRDNYNVHLDLPLLMSTLMVQSDDMNVIFSSNLSAEDRAKTARKKPIEEFDYYYDWTGHMLDMNNSSNDMEILAQNMVSYQVKETCIDSTGKVTQEKILKDEGTKSQMLICSEGETYKREELGMQNDNEKYREFLKEFLEKKYFLESGVITGNNGSSNYNPTIANSSNSSNNEFAQAIVNLAYTELSLNKGKNGKKYNNYFGRSDSIPWCANFVSYLMSETKVNGASIYPDIVPFRSASCGTLIKNFDSSDKSNINFYYNDNCKNLIGKNNSENKYIPKPGDLIFFDWGKNFYDISSKTQDHVGLVIKYENGKVYTIEGNSGNRVAERSYNITSCAVIGFGSWY